MITSFYIALPTLLPLVTGPFISFLKPSQLPREYTISKINLKNHLCPHRYPSTPGWREAIMVKCLAQGHKCHDRDSNPYYTEQNHNSVSSVLLSAWPFTCTSFNLNSQQVFEGKRENHRAIFSRRVAVYMLKIIVVSLRQNTVVVCLKSKPNLIVWRCCPLLKG